jgi:hypothetical protein
MKLSAQGNFRKEPQRIVRLNKDANHIRISVRYTFETLNAATLDGLTRGI